MEASQAPPYPSNGPMAKCVGVLFYACVPRVPWMHTLSTCFAFCSLGTNNYGTYMPQLTETWNLFAPPSDLTLEIFFFCFNFISFSGSTLKLTYSLHSTLLAEMPFWLRKSQSKNQTLEIFPDFHLGSPSLKYIWCCIPRFTKRETSEFSNSDNGFRISIQFEIEPLNGRGTLNCSNSNIFFFFFFF